MTLTNYDRKIRLDFDQSTDYPTQQGYTTGCLSSLFSNQFSRLSGYLTEVGIS